ncbi:thioredoxin [Campylobacter novaezeelandiae]|uniref:Thioredoxin n=1 Tax=Campylobacter novaezeelandiae TaxID=2267891 RepID=A0A4Q9JV77_9BACT|nr:thioredoxin family protein [Campylobacter novaezeelandiae]TBR80849.1 thioredoxin [Campylobacter novaezeelandiae]TBR81505.1 thioredoxin [Campylobacter novaezeelandiae]
MIKKILCGLFILFLYACNDEQINKNILSNNSALSKEQLEHSNSLDINSYKEIAIFFKDNQNIIFDDKKPTFIIFSSNNCKYCNKLREEIKEDKKLQDKLRKDYNSYYINISYQKIHNINKQKQTTQDLIQNYDIQSTPTLIFFNSSGKMLLNYPGLMGAKRLALTMDILKENQNLTEDELLKKLFLAYRENNV